MKNIELELLQRYWFLGKKLSRKLVVFDRFLDKHPVCLAILVMFDTYLICVLCVRLFYRSHVDMDLISIFLVGIFFYMLILAFVLIPVLAGFFIKDLVTEMLRISAQVELDYEQKTKEETLK